MEYAAPTTVDEARTLLADNPGSRVFAGATDVVPQMRSGRPEPSVLIDLKPSGAHYMEQHHVV